MSRQGASDRIAPCKVRQDRRDYNSREEVVSSSLVQFLKDSVGARRLFVRAFAASSIVAAACSNGAVSGPEGARLGGDLDGRAATSSGLEQRLVTRVEAPPAGSPYRALLTATSTLVNTGSATLRVKARTCFVREDDVETTAQMDRFEPFIACAAIEMDTDLAPGQSIGPLEVQFGVRSTAGDYRLKVRHALAPDLRAEASFRVP